MADERKVIIELKISEDVGDGASDAEKEENKRTNDLVKKLKAIQHPFATLENQLIKKAFPGKTEVVSYIVGKATSLAKNTALYFINRYYNLAENYRSEENLNNTMSVLSHIGEGFTSVLGGAITGAKGGVPGAVIGAIAGAGFWAGNTALNAYKAHDQENISLSTMRIQSSYQKVRLGLIDDGRGTQN